MDTQTQEQLTQISVRLPNWLRRKAKAQAALTNRSLQAVITELLTEWLKEQEKEAGHGKTNS